MHSPLPDSSALEAGIIEDAQPSRLSRVQDSVRNLLRTSFRSSVLASPTSPRHEHQTSVQHDGELPSPSSTIPFTASPTNSDAPLTNDGRFPPAPPSTYARQIQHIAHQSALFNTRAVAALQHPDLSDPSLAVFLQQKSAERQKRAWKRSKNRKLRHASRKDRKTASWAVCAFAGLLLAAVVATYLVLATADGVKVSLTAHVLFILGILLSTIVFVHSLVRMCMLRRHRGRYASFDSPRIYVSQHGRLKRGRRRHEYHRHEFHRHEHHRHRHHGSHRQMPSMSGETRDFVPPTPIQVHQDTDEAVGDLRPDSRDAMPSAASISARASMHQEAYHTTWDKNLDANLPHPPPPAYGRWRGSVRANPDLLHWSPVVPPGTPTIPSPTYETAMRDAVRGAMAVDVQQGQDEVVVVEVRSSPPSYHGTPPRVDGRQGQAGPAGGGDRVAQPEMVEGRGIGIAN